MKNLLLVMFAFVMLSFCSMAVSAQKATRINLSRGVKSTVVTGTLNGYRSSRTFVIRVRRGQTLRTENAGKNYITVGIDAPRGSKWEADMDLSCHSTQEVKRAYPGDYIIRVTECNKADRWRGMFRLKVSVR